MFIRMERANVRIGREKYDDKFVFDYFQVEIDGRLEISSRYGSSMASLMVDSGDLPIAIVRNLSIRGIGSSEYEIIDGEIIDEGTGDKKKINPRGEEFVSDLTQKIDDAFMMASLGN